MIEDVVLGNTQQQGEQGLNVARTVGLMAGIAVEAGGATVNRLCGSSLQALCKRRMRSWRMLRMCKSSEDWSTCTISRWMRVWT